ncbi:zinc-binding dehydrogenase [Actinomadura harenae]|uniref:Alcohol dehydrogenase n=1 Tax=Actinomadura harenae TaxID=2483351 RepID=A0A3M2M232_9ACTN|nr:zinc-binding dehydrogenase [Actinomadura harenae]RMI43794.1 alcohol dehydrogenase [Actinomadura harenae]
MRALVYDPTTAHGVRFDEIDEPRPGPSEVLIRVEAASLNFGELAFAERQLRPGEVFGKDASGVVVQAAADGSGPAEGTRVVSFAGTGGWAQLRAADTANVAVVPDSIDLGEAAAVPAAGVTALQAVRRLGSVLGRRVLVTGASGGVGRFAVQLAAQAGAHVIASVGAPERAEGLEKLGAAEILTGSALPDAPVYGVLDNVGGRLLSGAFALLEPGGVLLSIGWASREPDVLHLEEARMRGGHGRLEPFAVSAPFAADTSDLLHLLEQGRLDPQIGWRTPWDQAEQAVEALLTRRIQGKAVLDLV